MFKAIIASVFFGCTLGLAACSASVASSSESTDFTVSDMPEFSGKHVWKMDRERSALQFQATHAGETFTGDFGQFGTAIMLDPDAPEMGEIHAVINLETIDAGDDDRNANLPGPLWFNIAKFPLARYSSKEISKTGEGTYRTEGTLTIKGINQPVALEFTLEIDGDTASAKGAALFSRRDFNLGEGEDFSGEDWVKFPVKVLIDITATR